MFDLVDMEIAEHSTHFRRFGLVGMGWMEYIARLDSVLPEDMGEEEYNDRFCNKNSLGNGNNHRVPIPAQVDNL